MPDRFSSFAELSRHMREGVDFEIRLSRGKWPVVIVAPHAGRIEPGTGRIARAIAGKEFSVYEFRGIRPSENWKLHLTAHQFDEPRCLAALQLAHLAVTIHGVKGEEPFVMVGGKAVGLVETIADSLSEAGVPAREPTGLLRGLHPSNLCNRGHAGRGVQIEASAELRRSMMTDGPRRNRFASAVRSPLLARFASAR
ncbi:MAG: poly-gamma-glutamate hydrolase family protein [Desulfococcaceae bacterium]